MEPAEVTAETEKVSKVHNLLEENMNKNKYGIHYSRKEYREEYLRSEGWAEKREEILARDKICVLCEERKATDPHHVTYENLPFENLETDIIGICRTCHTKIHKHKFLSQAGTIEKLKQRFHDSKENPSLLENRKTKPENKRKKTLGAIKNKRKRVREYRKEGMIKVKLTPEQWKRNNEFEKVRRQHSEFYRSCNSRRHGRLQ